MWIAHGFLMESVSVILKSSSEHEDREVGIQFSVFPLLAGVYYEQGKLDQAIATYREALVHEPNFPEAYNNLGNALREAGRADEAIQCYTLCIQLQLGRPQVGNTNLLATNHG